MSLAELNKSCSALLRARGTTGLGTVLNEIIALERELYDHDGTFHTFADECDAAIEELIDDHATFKTAVDQMETAVEELMDDHATFKTAVDQTETAIEELMDDHATFKTAVDETKTAVDELIDDHATFKTAADQTKTAVDELIDDHAVIKTWMDESDDDQDKITDFMSMFYQNAVTGGDWTMTAGAAATLTGAGWVEYQIAGAPYYYTLDTTIDLEDAGDILATKWGAWRILIARDGTVTTQDTDAGAAMAYDNEEDALLNIAAVAPTASTVCLGYITVQAPGGAPFNIGTDNLNAAGVTANVYYERGAKKRLSGLNSARAAATVINAGAATYNAAAIDVNRNGAKLAQIAANPAETFDDADTVADTKFGAWLQCTGLTGLATYTLAADGRAGAVSAMAYDSQALAEAAIDTLVDQLPSQFVPVSRIVVQNASGGAFTAGVTNLDAAGITTTITDDDRGGWSKSVPSGFGSNNIFFPTIPAAITASLLATLAASKPAAAPATITATKPTAGPATLGAAKPASGPATLSAAKPASAPATFTAAKPSAPPAATFVASKPDLIT